MVRFVVALSLVLELGLGAAHAAGWKQRRPTTGLRAKRVGSVPRSSVSIAPAAAAPRRADLRPAAPRTVRTATKLARRSPSRARAAFAEVVANVRVFGTLGAAATTFGFLTTGALFFGWPLAIVGAAASAIVGSVILLATRAAA